MMLFTFPEQAALAAAMGQKAGAWQVRRFPDGESYVRVLEEVKGQETVILCSLNQPDAKTLPLVFLARTLKELGASKVTLVAPYLAYMRQDKRFNEGEAVTADVFAGLLSAYVDALVTIDPHLHRHHDLNEIYSCKCKAITAAPLMQQWIKYNIEKPLVIGPDAESEQWVKQVAEGCDAPYIVLEKVRHGDRKVEITLPDITRFKGRTPVLVDDIISTAGTMIKVTGLLKTQKIAEIACLATHGLFAENAYNSLRKAGAVRIVTANTISHPSNGLEVGALLMQALRDRA